MKSKPDKCTFNKRKFMILDIVHLSPTFLTPSDIARRIGLSSRSVKSALTGLTKWGYIHRKTEYRIHYRNYYCYRHLKPKGIRIYDRLKRRIGIAELSGVEVPLNFDKPVPQEVLHEYYRKGGEDLSGQRI